MMNDADAPVVTTPTTTPGVTLVTSNLQDTHLSMTTTTTTTNPTASAVRPSIKRDYLRSHEREIQQLWRDHHVFESNAATTNNDDSFFVTFPYPYMNGVLHIGHAFSFSKALFRSLYEQLQGHNTLLPFSFHCTGMPIQAVTSIWWRCWKRLVITLVTLETHILTHHSSHSPSPSLSLFLHSTGRE